MSKMIQYKVKNKRNEITILSIKGTSFRRDIYLDMQLYFPAILLNLINPLSSPLIRVTIPKYGNVFSETSSP